MVLKDGRIFDFITSDNDAHKSRSSSSTDGLPDERTDTVEPGKGFNLIGLKQVEYVCMIYQSKGVCWPPTGENRIGNHVMGNGCVTDVISLSPSAPFLLYLSPIELHFKCSSACIKIRSRMKSKLIKYLAMAGRKKK